MAKKPPRVPRTHDTPTLQSLVLDAAIFAACKRRGIAPDAEVPREAVDDAVRELYGDWTDEARRAVRQFELTVR